MQTLLPSGVFCCCCVWCVLLLLLLVAKIPVPFPYNIQGATERRWDYVTDFCQWNASQKSLSWVTWQTKCPSCVQCWCSDRRMVQDEASKFGVCSAYDGQGPCWPTVHMEHYCSVEEWEMFLPVLSYSLTWSLQPMAQLHPSEPRFWLLSYSLS